MARRDRAARLRASHAGRRRSRDRGRSAQRKGARSRVPCLDSAPRHRRTRHVSRRADRAPEARAGFMKPRFFKTPADFRAWLEKHHADTPEFWVGFYKKASGKVGITYHEGV